MDLACHIPGCLELTGTHTVCDFHRKTMSKSQRKSMDKMWHDIVVEKGRTGAGYTCYYCKNNFLREFICGDHCATKGSHPELRYDTNNGVPCCMACNESSTKNKKIKELTSQLSHD